MSGIVFGCIAPHPPLLVPSIGRGQESAVQKTGDAMEKLANLLAQQHPDAAVLISPHAESSPDAMGILTAPACTGDLQKWGDRSPAFTFANDIELVSLIRKEAQSSGIPTRSIGISSYALDHGAMVPLHFLMRSLQQVPIIPIAFSWLPLKTHYVFGKAIEKAAKQRQKRVAIIASGDLSHRLLPQGPYGYEPMGPIFDKRLVDDLSKLDVKDILNMDDDLIERAGQCGLRSFVILLGALDGLKVKPTILSYEGPFGVGYMVATFEIQQGERRNE